MCALLLIGAAFLLGVSINVPILGLLGIPVAVVYYAWAWKRATLWPISGESAKNSRQANWIVVTLAFLSMFWS
jgi:hypothetical protein